MAGHYEYQIQTRRGKSFPWTHHATRRTAAGTRRLIAPLLAAKTQIRVDLVIRKIIDPASL